MRLVAESFIAFHWETICYACLTFALGVFSGFQILYARYPNEYGMAFRTGSGLLYLCIRGALPAGLYLACHKTHLLGENVSPLWQAVFLGLGSEIFLRSRILLVTRPTGPNQLPAEKSSGPADAVAWI